MKNCVNKIQFLLKNIYSYFRITAPLSFVVHALYSLYTGSLSHPSSNHLNMTISKYRNTKCKMIKRSKQFLNDKSFTYRFTKLTTLLLSIHRV